MHKSLTIAFYSLKEGLKDKFFIGLIILFLLSIGLSEFFAKLSLIEKKETFKIFFFSSHSILVSLIGVLYVPIAQSKEFETKIIYIVLSKPVKILEYVIGKILGYSGLTITFIIITLIPLYFISKNFILLFDYLIFLFLGSVILISASILISIIFRSISISVLSTVLFFIVAHSTDNIMKLAEKTENIFYILVSKVLYFIFPSLDKFFLIKNISYNISNHNSLLNILLYSSIYLSIVIIVSVIDLDKKEF